jgi:hypothetical protein
LVPINTARYRVASTVTRKKIVVMMLSHGALLSPETVLSPPSCHLAVSRVATTRPPTHPPRAGGGGGSTPPHRPPPSLASPAPRAPCALGTVPPTPFRLAPPPIFIFYHITRSKTRQPKAVRYCYSLAFNHNTHIHTLIFFSYRTRTRTRSRTLRAAVCAPAAPAAAPRQFLGSCLHVARWQYAWYVWEDYITAQRDQS